MVWEKSWAFEHNQGIGAAEINLSKLDLSKPVTGWYRLLPVTSIQRVFDDSESEDSNC